MADTSKSPRSGKSEPQPAVYASEGLAGTNLIRAGDHNQRVTLQAIRTHGSLTRVDLARITGLTAPTILNITNRLIDSQLIRDAGRTSGGLGKPATKFTINPDGAYSIGLNIDRDHLTYVVLDFEGNVIGRASEEIQFASPNQVTEFFRKQVAEYFPHDDERRNRLIGVGIAIPDDLGKSKTSLEDQPPEYGTWSEIEPVDVIRQVLDVPVFIENDAAAAAIGELQFGLGLRARNFVYVLMSAGLGGSIVIDGHCYRGTNGRSGEIGFLPRIHPWDPMLNDLEKNVGDSIVITSLLKMFAQKGINLRDLTSAAGLDELSRSNIQDWVNRAADFLFLPLLTLTCGLDPDAVYFGGRVPSFLLDQLAARLTMRFDTLRQRMPINVSIERASLAEDACAIGAAVLPFNGRFLPMREAVLKSAADL